MVKALDGALCRWLMENTSTRSKPLLKRSMKHGSIRIPDGAPARLVPQIRSNLRLLTWNTKFGQLMTVVVLKILNQIWSGGQELHPGQHLGHPDLGLTHLSPVHRLFCGERLSLSLFSKVHAPVQGCPLTLTSDCRDT